MQFDGKTFTNLYGNRKIEPLAICFAGKLIALKELPNKKAVSIFTIILDCLNKRNLVLEIIVSDTELISTGRKGGVITVLQKEFPSSTFEPCRLHVLDLVLKHQFTNYFGGETKSAELQYNFVKTLKTTGTTLKNRALKIQLWYNFLILKICLLQSRAAEIINNC